MSAAASTALLATTAFAALTVTTAQPAAAALPPLNCTNTIFITDTVSGGVRAVNATTGAVTPGVVFDGLTGGGTNPNQLGISSGGRYGISTNSTRIVRHDRVTEQTTSIPRQTATGVNTVAGGINLNNDLFYYGGYNGAGTQFTMWVYNPVTNQSVGPVARVTVPSGPGGNGDLAFDKNGRMYLVNASDSSSALYYVNAEIPTTASGTVPTLPAVEISRGPVTAAINGMTFGSDGYLYLGSTTTLQRSNPITGAPAPRTPGGSALVSMAGVNSTDLGSCSSPSTLTVEVDLPDDRQRPGDQFTVGGSGGDYGPSRPFPTGTTSGSDGGVQDGPGQSASAIVLPGTEMTVDLGPAPGSGTNLGTYVPSHSCVDESTGRVLAEGPGSTATFTVPTDGTGAAITCSFVAAEPKPELDLDKTVSPTSFTRIGQTLSYSFAVTNVGNVALSDFRLSDPMPGLTPSTPTCAPIAQGGTLPVQGTTTCSATYTVTAADIAAGTAKTNTASIAGTPPPLQGTRISTTDSATAAFAAVPPTATDDAAGTPLNTPVTLPASGNDTPGSGAIVATSTVFTSADATEGGKRLETAEGVWQVTPAGAVLFTPADGYTGTTPAVGYRITDENNLTDTASLTVTVRPGPTATPDTGATTQNRPTTVSPLVNDTPGQTAPGGSGAFDPQTLVFDPARVPAGSTVSTDGRTLDVPGEGGYAIDPATGEVEFTPVATFTGTTTPVGYLVDDQAGNPTGSTITITVAAVNPTAIDDAANTPFATPVSLPAGTNDTAGPGGAIDQSLTVLTSPDAIDGGKTLETAQGTWRVETDGTVTFTPAAGFTGTTTPVEYRITDANGQSDTGNLQVTVRPGPVATPSTATTPQNVDVVVDVIDGDQPGRNADGSAGELDPASVVFPTAGQPAGATVSPDGKQIVVPGEGTYTIDPATGAVTFDPEAGFSGPATPVAYEVTDQIGNTAGSTLTVTVTAITPVAIPDEAKGAAGATVTVPLLANDQPGAASAPLVPGSVVLDDTGLPAGSTVSADGKTVVVPGEGEWQVQPDGSVVFTPAAGFDGRTTPVTYTVEDENGTPASSTVTVTVGQAPVAAPDGATTPQNTPVRIDPLENDVAGDQGAPCTAPGDPAGCDTGTLDPTSVVFPTAGQPAGSTVAPGGKQLTVPGEGVYEIDPVTGEITFTPEAGLTGPTTPVAYTVTDSYGGTATGSVTVVVTAVTPQATDDTAETPFNTPVTLTGATDDVAGDAQGGTPAPIVEGSVVFPATGQPAGAVVSDDNKTLTLPGQGVFEAQADGTVVFTPDAAFAGTTPPVTYRVSDANGTTDTATLLVTVRPGPVAAPDEESTLQGDPVTVPVLDNDVAGPVADGSAGELDPASVVFPTAGQPAGSTVAPGGKQLTVPGEGVYTVEDDGQITFAPVSQFTGPATPIAYTVTDDSGNPATSTLVVTVTAVVPTAGNDTASTPFATAVTFPFLDNDAAGDDSKPLDVDSAEFEAGRNPASATISADGRTISVPGEGRYELAADGTVTFTPASGFSGVTTPVTYTVRDSNGTPARAQISVTVQPGPEAANDTATTPQNVDVTLSVLVNDTTGLDADGTPALWQLDSVVFPADGQPDGSTVSADGKQLTVPGEGVYTANPDGTVTLDPEARFTGRTTSVAYTATDALGNSATARIVVTVNPILPIANDDAASTPFQTPVTLPGALDDEAGADSAPLRPELTVFPTDGQPAAARVSADGKTLVVDGEGRWEVNADGSVTFTPDQGYEGTTSPVTYRIEDANGTTDTAQLVVTVRIGASASDDDRRTRQNVDVVVPVLDNDAPGLDAAGDQGTWDLDSLVFPATGQPQGAQVAADGKRIVIPGEGAYTVEADGTVIFDPEAQFTGVATPVRYAVTDSLGTTVSAEIAITVTPVVPVARDDRERTPFETPVTVPVLDNDRAADGVPLVPGTLALIDPRTGDRVDAVFVRGEGTWRVEGGEIVFEPARGFTGATTPIGYVVEDENGTPANASVVVTVEGPGSASPDRDRTPPATAITVPVLDNDRAAPGEQLVPGSVCLLPRGASGDCVKQHTEPEVGSWVVNPDGTITFTPAEGFSGVATIEYAVEDTAGNVYVTTLTITVDDAPEDDAPGGDGGSGGLIPDAGGPAMLLLLAGLVSLGAGTAIVIAGRRRTRQV